MRRIKPIINFAGYYYFKNYFPIFLFTKMTLICDLNLVLVFIAKDLIDADSSAQKSTITLYVFDFKTLSIFCSIS